MCVLLSVRGSKTIHSCIEPLNLDLPLFLCLRLSSPDTLYQPLCHTESALYKARTSFSGSADAISCPGPDGEEIFHNPGILQGLCSMEPQEQTHKAKCKSLVSATQRKASQEILSPTQQSDFFLRPSSGAAHIWTLEGNYFARCISMAQFTYEEISKAILIAIQMEKASSVKAASSCHPQQAAVNHGLSY
ncbi:uncharacterized protein RG961_015102 [Leptosomus discolor]